MPPRHLRASLAGFGAYTPGQQPPDGEGWVKLNTNESPWPPSPAVLDAIRAAVDENLRLYPSPTAQAAREAIARHHGLGPESVAMGNGGDELIELAFRAFAGAGDRVALPAPTYPLLPPVAAMHENRVAIHALSPDWSLPETYFADPAPLRFLVNPNSPTGTWVGRPEVARAAATAPGVLVLDEAYVDFALEDRIDLLHEGVENLLILRTFSKSHALAGMRIGYALGHPDLIAALDLVKDSYNLGRLAIAAAVAAIADLGHHDRLVAFVLGERAWLGERLRGRGFEVLPSATNFLFVKPPTSHPASRLHEALRRRRVLVRHYEQEPVAGWFRVTVGTRHQHETLLDALQEVMH